MEKIIRENFFPLKKKLNTKNIDNLFGLEIIFNNVSKNFVINDISSLSNLRNKSLIFLHTDFRNEKVLLKDIHVISDVANNQNYYNNITIVKNLNEAYKIILDELFYHDDQPGYPDEFTYVNGSYISNFCHIENDVEIGKNCVISRGVQIGRNSIIKNNVVIKNSVIGNNVIICDNSSIGTTGFGFDFNVRGASSLSPQIGFVVIEDNVHLGSSCTIDRGKIDHTFIGKNSMIDNMVHIAHNVIIGDNACIAAQTGISGSVEIGQNVTIGGQAGLAGHLKIGKNSVIAAKSGVTKNIKENSVVAGFPAIDIKEWKKNIIRQRKNGY